MLYTNTMSKKPKKRTKRYQGEDAKKPTAGSSPVVHRYEAVQRSRLGDWWQTKKRPLKVGGIATAVIGGAVWLIFELFRLIF